MKYSLVIMALLGYVTYTEALTMRQMTASSLNLADDEKKEEVKEEKKEEAKEEKKEDKKEESKEEKKDEKKEEKKEDKKEEKKDDKKEEKGDEKEEKKEEKKEVKAPTNTKGDGSRFGDLSYEDAADMHWHESQHAVPHPDPAQSEKNGEPSHETSAYPKRFSRPPRAR